MKKEKITTIIMLIILLVIEAISVFRMIGGHQPIAATAHTLIGVAFLLCGIYALKVANKPDNNPMDIRASFVYPMIMANLFMLIVIAIHDMDHMRQAMEWGYVFTPQLLMVNLIVYIPNTLSFILIAKRKFAGIWASIISGVLIAGAFLKLHLLGATIKVWGPWNRSFFALHVDSLSWWMLAFTAIFGVLLSMYSCYILGREVQRRDQLK